MELFVLMVVIGASQGNYVFFDRFILRVYNYDDSLRKDGPSKYMLYDRETKIVHFVEKDMSVRRTMPIADYPKGGWVFEGRTVGLTKSENTSYQGKAAVIVKEESIIQTPLGPLISTLNTVYSDLPELDVFRLTKEDKSILANYSEKYDSLGYKMHSFVSYEIDTSFRMTILKAELVKERFDTSIINRILNLPVIE